jgi:hypothetical protein
MKRTVAAIGILAFALSVGKLRAAEKNTLEETDYTSAQIKTMAREAHTVEQYTVLADYYATRQRMYKRKAAEEMHLWALRAEMVNPLSEKWPRPVDSARNLHDYYEYKAAQATALCAKYNELADALAASR